METDTLRTLERSPSHGKAQQLLIFLHGYGSNADDLFGLGSYFSEALPHAAILSVDAIHPCESGMGRQWFSLADWSREGLRKGAAAALPQIDRHIGLLCERWEVPAQRTAVIGFSQGTMMALILGLRHTPTLGAIIGYSGTLPGPDDLAQWGASRPPVLLVHGEADDVVPFTAMAQAEEALAGMGVKVESLARPMLPHTIDEAGLAKGVGFLRRKLV